MIQAVLTGMRLHVKQFSRNAFDLSGVVLWPILYASIAYYLLDAKHDPRVLVSASLGAAVMLMWSSSSSVRVVRSSSKGGRGRSSSSSQRQCL